MALDKNSEDPTTYIARREYGKAIEIYRSRLSKQPKQEALRLALADALLMDARMADAIAEYKTLGMQYANAGFLVKAIAMYKKILKLSPEDSDAQRLLSELSSQRHGGAPKPSPIQFIEPVSAEAPPIPDSEPIELGADAIMMSEPADTQLEIESKLFTDLLREELQEFISHLALRHYEEDTIVVQEGDPGDSMFIVVRGQVRVLTRDARQNEIVLAILGEGSFFGEVALLTGRPRTATIMTNLTTELLELSREDFEGICARFPNVRNVMEVFHKQRAFKTIEALIQSLREKS